METVTDEIVRDMVREIVTEVSPARVYLFGSRARGTYRTDSDIDLLVVERSDSDRYSGHLSTSIRLRRRLRGFRVPKDIIVFSEDEMEKWRSTRNHVVAAALEEGVLLYERP